MPRLQTVADPFGLWRRAGRLARRAGDATADAALQTGIAQALVERVLGDLLQRGVIHRLVAAAADDPRTSELAESALASPRTERIAERVLGGPEFERLLTAALDSPRTTELVGRALDSGGMDRLVAEILDSRLLDASVARVLDSEELWIVVEEIARSPAVTEAISHQGVGFADQVAGELGARSRRADARLERAARRLLHRGPPPAGSAAPATPDERP